MKRYTSTLTLLGLAALLFVSCEKETRTRQFTFNATLEQPKGDDENGNAKVFLDHEKYIHWEEGDVISVASDKTDAGQYPAILVNSGPASEDFHLFQGVFIAPDLPWESAYFLGLYPQSENNVITPAGSGSSNFTAQIYLPDVQHLRTDSKSDYTFANGQFPMVGWYGGVWLDDETAYNLDFHSLAGLVRVQLRTNTGKKLKKIEFTSRDETPKQLKGLFNVNGYKTFAPWLTAAANTAANQTVTIDCGEDGLDISSLRSFYLILPAVNPTGQKTQYKLTMKAYNEDDAICEMPLTANVRRNGITYLQALDITSWAASGATVGIVGNGTEDRPFKIYSVEDLVKVKEAFAQATPAINGITITGDTWFRIMKSNIELTNVNWTGGISNFTGHMTYGANNMSSQGITNNSDFPIFASVGENGKVEGVDVRRSATATLNYDFATLAHTNRGEITNCVVKNSTADSIVVTHTGSATHNLAGICIDNYGTISGCGNRAKMSNSKGNVAGICINNHGTVSGCYATAPMAVGRATAAAGVVFYNLEGGLVEDCYFATSVIGSSINWGGVVYGNDATVRHCYLSRNGALYTTEFVGGVAYHNHAGALMDYCWVEGPIRGSHLGGIACENYGRIVNSFCNSATLNFTLSEQTDPGSHCIGGIAAVNHGDDASHKATIENCFVHLSSSYILRDALGTLGGIVGQLGDHSVIKNCYFYEQVTPYSLDFRGARSGSDVDLSHSCYIVGQTSADAQVTHYAVDGFTTLVGNLNGADKPTDGKSWQLNGVPVLAPYVITPAKHHRR